MSTPAESLQGGARLPSPVPNSVLVADDDRTTRNVIARVLELHGYDVTVASCGSECIERFESDPADALLLDVYMPDIDGMDVCRRLKRRHKDTPVICMTAAAESWHVAAAFEAGADDFLIKPINPLVLKARLRGQIERYQSLAEMERLRNNLNRFVSRRTVEMVNEYTSTGELPPPRESDVSIMFTDVRGFTALSQQAEPHCLFAALSDNLGMQVDCVLRHGGYVDKFAGDGIMAVFDDGDRARHACECACEILDLTADAMQYQAEPELRLGIGIHSGAALIGNVGSEQHLDYSVIGDTVNLAARLCGAAEPMTAVVSEATVAECEAVAGLRFVEPRAIDVRGVSERIGVHRLLREPFGVSMRTPRRMSQLSP